MTIATQAFTQKVDYIPSERGYSQLYSQELSKNPPKRLVAHWFKDGDGRLFCKWLNE